MFVDLESLHREEKRERQREKKGGGEGEGKHTIHTYKHMGLKY